MSDLLGAHFQVRVDYDARVPSEQGFATVLPNISIPGVLNWTNWSFTIDFSHVHWEYRGDREMLGYNPAHRMLRVGNTLIGGDVFLSWMPLEALDNDLDIRAIRHTKESTIMHPRLRRLTQAAIAIMMYRSHYTDVYPISEYPDISSDDEFALETNLM